MYRVLDSSDYEVLTIFSEVGGIIIDRVVELNVKVEDNSCNGLIEEVIG